MIGLTASTIGIVGPNIDGLFLPARSVTDAIAIGEILGGDHLGHRVLMFGPRRVGGEARHHLKDPAIVLKGADLANLEVAPLLDSLDLVADWATCLARPEEVQMHRVNCANGRRSGCGDEGLRCNQAAVDSFSESFSTRPASARVHIGRDLVEIEAVEQPLYLVRHRDAA